MNPQDIIAGMTPEQRERFEELKLSVHIHARWEPCWSCDERAEFLCDRVHWTLTADGEKSTHTCDMPLCRSCAVSDMRGPDRHLCSPCAAEIAEYIEMERVAKVERERRASSEGVNRCLGRKYSKLRERGQLLKMRGTLVYSGRKPKP